MEDELHRIRNTRLKTSPSKDSIRLVTEASQKIAPDQERLGEWLPQYVANQSNRIALDVDIARILLPDGSKILEAGSAPFLFTTALSTFNYDLTGVDIEPERFQKTLDKLGLIVKRCDIEQEPLPFQDNSFDAVIINEVFEHLRINPIFTLREIYRVIKPNGMLLLSTPNLKSLAGIYKFLVHSRAYSCSWAVYEEFEKIEKLGHMGHVREYTPLEVVEFLNRIGFSVEIRLFRGEYFSLTARILTSLFARLKPFVSYIGVKEAADNSISSSQSLHS